MSELEFYPLGTDTNREAVRIKELYVNRGVDDQVRAEFGATVTAYTTLSLGSISLRLRERYTGLCSPASGALAVNDGQDIGMAFWGDKTFQGFDGHAEVKGINVSAWLLSQYRNRGFGKRLIQYATVQAVAQGTESGKQVWTSVDTENHASRLACEYVGFSKIGTQPDKPERLLYLLRAE